VIGRIVSGLSMKALDRRLCQYHRRHTAGQPKSSTKIVTSNFLQLFRKRLGGERINRVRTPRLAAARRQRGRPYASEALNSASF
jgi:hypothetical protein